MEFTSAYGDKALDLILHPPVEAFREGIGSLCPKLMNQVICALANVFGNESRLKRGSKNDSKNKLEQCHSVVHHTVIRKGRSH